MVFLGMVPSQDVLREREDVVRHVDLNEVRYCGNSADMRTGFCAY